MKRLILIERRIRAGEYAVLLFLLLMITFSSRALGQNLIDLTYGEGAGSFELGDFHNNDLDDRVRYQVIQSVSPQSMTGWTVGSGTPGIHWTALRPRPDSGWLFADLFGLFLGESSPPKLQTVIPTTIGKKYRISFAHAAGNTASNKARVEVNGESLLEFSGPTHPSGNVANWSENEVVFMATTVQSTIAFQAIQSNGYGPIIDTVSVEQVTSITDAEASVCLFPAVELVIKAPDTSKTYSLDYSSNLTHWIQDKSFSGSVFENSEFRSTRNAGARFWRVRELP
ncbi:DUF642 domain-containing protein [Roseibacillus persicicus]|uniref:DUF642 domain-containing protein n=1 Tax=Roseibacillus persicicus TaxID=454148 RepID=UPI00398B13AC